MDITQSGFTADELQQALFERYNVQVEKSTFSTITLLLTLGTTRSKVSRLYDAMLRLAKEKRPPRPLGRMPEIPRFSRLASLPRDAFTRPASGCRCWTTTATPTRRWSDASAATRSCRIRPAFRCWCPAR